MLHVTRLRFSRLALTRPLALALAPTRPPALALALALALAVAVALAACSPGSVNPGGDNPPDATPPPAVCEPSFDDDADGIGNGLEGCLPAPGRDTDGDGRPDWRDDDSDNDGVDDRYEDRNGDGMLGSCATSCGTPADCPPEHGCSFSDDRTGAGLCVSWECLDGETDPHATDTDGDGAADGFEGTWVCNPPDEDHPDGLKQIQYVDSVDTIPYATPNWKIALELAASHGAVTLANPATLDSAYLFDLPTPGSEVAGFLISRTAREANAFLESQGAFSRLDALAGSNAILRASGATGVSLDGHATVRSTVVVLNVTAAADAPTVRAQLLPALLDRPAADVPVPPVGWTGEAGVQIMVTYQTEYRADVGQVVIMGAVALLSHYEDPARPTGFLTDDLANGTGLSHSGNGEAIECEQFLVAEVPKADIIWVIDESGSMDDDRAKVAMNATSFFEKAVLAGLDFRMGVTDMNNSNGGRFSSRDGGSSTGDRWLGAAGLAMFQNGINDPSGPDGADGGSEHGLTNGRAAIMRHLPRDAADAARIRPDAKLVVLYVTDEHPDEIEDAGIIPDSNVVASMADKADIAAFMQPYIMEFEANDAVAHLIGIPEATANCSSSGEVSYGYIDLLVALGGQFGSICQADLGPTIDAILDDIVGSASPVVLEFVPISSTIAVVRDNVLVPRSRTMGWDFRASSNSIVFYNMPFDPLSPSELVISYRRWAEQVPIE